MRWNLRGKAEAPSWLSFEAQKAMYRSQIHRSPGFITSNLIGKSKSGSMIKEFEASHGQWEEDSKRNVS